MTEWVFLTSAILNLIAVIIDISGKFIPKRKSKKEDSRSAKRKSS
ncbi:hypothetical protein [Salimicrobium halophilum]|uniref:Uncharacterized protein n=1 Tax=Salimicrobium halophilum TaxID=86666 RepID=A0A1G8QZG6_9BACI|nr:hypothetical protein [Salimicrobium halophilum]SDJ10152.1 hypothetical protein SAMN04490247_0727 [Salimicrobium halophilum]